MTQRELTPGEGLEFVIRGVRDRIWVWMNPEELYTCIGRMKGRKWTEF